MPQRMRPPAHDNRITRENASTFDDSESAASSSIKRPVSTDNGISSGPSKRRQADVGHLTNDSGGDKYNIVRILDQGSFGIVTLVYRNDNPRRTYARKQLRLAKVPANTIRQEVDLIRKARHRHIVNVIEEYADEEWHYIIMDPAAECDLKGYLRDTNYQPKNASEWEDFAMRRSRLLQWMYCLAVTVQHIHKLGIRHRDIKPENILVHGENILLTDFGTSFYSEKDTRYTRTTTPGTNKYLPPEAAGHCRFGRSGDIFSLGCVFWEMAEALSRPVLACHFPSIIETYSISASDPRFLNEMDKIKEYSGLRKRLDERSQFAECFLDMLLRLIRNMLNLDKTSRHTADQVVDSLVTILRESHSTALPCCDSLDNPMTPRGIRPQIPPLHSGANSSIKDDCIQMGDTVNGQFSRQYLEPPPQSAAPITPIQNQNDGRKRKEPHRINDVPGNGDDTGNSVASSLLGESEGKQKLVCPYRRYKPDTYGDGNRKFRSCRDDGFEGISFLRYDREYSCP